jgi:hypothetical protein
LVTGDDPLPLSYELGHDAPDQLVALLAEVASEQKE